MGMEMAISRDTAALVAAQLTTACAIKSGQGKPDPTRPFEGQVLATYLRLFEAVREVDINRKPMSISDEALDSI